MPILSAFASTPLLSQTSVSPLDIHPKLDLLFWLFKDVSGCRAQICLNSILQMYVLFLVVTFA